MNSKLYISIVLISLLLYSCSASRRASQNTTSEGNKSESSIEFDKYNSLYISKIDAILEVDDENYDARLSLYYVPDSVLVVTAINAGFEIIRAGIFKDSIIYINRLDKLLIIFNQEENKKDIPVNFSDIEYLFNRSKFYEHPKLKITQSGDFELDLSQKDIRKNIFINGKTLKISRFEFFHKKTGEYVVGEENENSGYTVYSNYLLDDLVLKTRGGTTEYDKLLNINLEVNRSKYDVIYY